MIATIVASSRGIQGGMPRRLRGAAASGVTMGGYRIGQRATGIGQVSGMRRAPRRTWRLVACLGTERDCMTWKAEIPSSVR
ncbi:MAG: hypothetical protein Q8Q29_03560, partial [Actinomycetota bacterium]|nr:hypothetical protein [Actinomycetota bacterium]